jgi:hypothetical protein
MKEMEEALQAFCTVELVILWCAYFRMHRCSRFPCSLHSCIFTRSFFSVVVGRCVCLLIAWNCTDTRRARTFSPARNARGQQQTSALHQSMRWCQSLVANVGARRERPGSGFGGER